MLSYDKILFKSSVHDEIGLVENNIMQLSNDIHQLVSRINYISAGSPSRMDASIIEECGFSVTNLSQALQQLSCADQKLEQISLEKEDDHE